MPRGSSKLRRFIPGLRNSDLDDSPRKSNNKGNSCIKSCIPTGEDVQNRTKMMWVAYYLGAEWDDPNPELKPVFYIPWLILRLALIAASWYFGYAAIVQYMNQEPQSSVSFFKATPAKPLDFPAFQICPTNPELDIEAIRCGWFRNKRGTLEEGQLTIQAVPYGALKAGQTYMPSVAPTSPTTSPTESPTGPSDTLSPTTEYFYDWSNVGCEVSSDPIVSYDYDGCPIYAETISAISHCWILNGDQALQTASKNDVLSCAAQIVLPADPGASDLVALPEMAMAISVYIYDPPTSLPLVIPMTKNGTLIPAAQYSKFLFKRKIFTDVDGNVDVSFDASLYTTGLPSWGGYSYFRWDSNNVQDANKFFTDFSIDVYNKGFEISRTAFFDLAYMDIAVQEDKQAYAYTPMNAMGDGTAIAGFLTGACFWAGPSLVEYLRRLLINRRVRRKFFRPFQANGQPWYGVGLPPAAESLNPTSKEAADMPHTTTIKVSSESAAVLVRLPTAADPWTSSK